MRNLDRPLKDVLRPVSFVLKTSQTIEEAIRSIRRKKVDDKIFYFYVVDEDDRLKGVVSTRTILLKDPEQRVSDVMDKTVIRLSENQTLFNAMEYLASHRLLALPVIDEKDRLVGVVDVSQYMEESVKLSSSRAGHDVFQILGVHIEEGKKKGAWQTFRLRMPWIFCNIAGGTACAAISKIFDTVLSEILLLAMFIPLILTLSESVSMQSMSQSLQLLRKQKYTVLKLLQKGLSEWKTIFLIAITCSLIVGALSLLWGEGVRPALAIGLGLFLSIAVSATFGTVVPLILHAKEFDPKVAAGPVVLMFSDVMTTTIYLGLATYMLLR